ncbi:MAG: hypothetical protein DBX44_04690 [Oscillospiraceae bacterium]|nr:MAG: hypothetical protein DBX44_04690 [Oscillospiraceae bacterium]
MQKKIGKSRQWRKICIESCRAFKLDFVKKKTGRGTAKPHHDKEKAALDDGKRIGYHGKRNGRFAAGYPKGPDRVS